MIKQDFDNTFASHIESNMRIFCHRDIVDKNMVLLSYKIEIKKAYKEQTINFRQYLSWTCPDRLFNIHYLKKLTYEKKFKTKNV